MSNNIKINISSSIKCVGIDRWKRDMLIELTVAINGKTQPASMMRVPLKDAFNDLPDDIWEQYADYVEQTLIGIEYKEALELSQEFLKYINNKINKNNTMDTKTQNNDGDTELANADFAKAKELGYTPPERHNT